MSVGSAGPSATSRALPSAAPSAVADLQPALNRLFDAARTGNRRTWAGGLSERDPAFARRAESLYANLAGLRLDRLAVRLTGARQNLPASRRILLGPDARTWQATLDWALPEESSTAQQTVWLTLLPGPDGVRLAGTTDAADPDTPAEPIWWRRPVTRVDRGDVTRCSAPASGRRPGPT